jgi:hypothetical protein
MAQELGFSHFGNQDGDKQVKDLKGRTNGRQ